MELVEADAVRERLKAAVKGLPPKRAANILACVNLPASKRRRSAAGTATANPPAAPKRKRKDDGEKTPAASKPVLVLGR